MHAAGPGAASRVLGTAADTRARRRRIPGNGAPRSCVAWVDGAHAGDLRSGGLLLADS